MSTEEQNQSLTPEGGSPAVSEPSSETTPETEESSSAHYAAYADPYEDPYTAPPAEPTVPATAPTPPPPPPPAAESDSDEDDDDDEGMLRMSFLEHLEELRSRLIKALSGVAVAFFLSMTFSKQLWNIVQQPAAEALATLGYTDAGLVFTSPMEAFLIIWFKLPLLTSIFIASPWLLYQVWAFVAPGLYKKERRFAAPFIIISAGLFILGGLFAYFVGFRFGLTFLLGVGVDVNVRPMVTISEYFDIFVNVILGIAVVFELPVLIFFLTLLRIASPKFLITHSRYAILGIVILAAVITPTPDVFNLMIFSVPMVFLYFIGIFAGYMLELSREGKRLPWRKIFVWAAVLVLLWAGAVWLAVTQYGYRLIGEWPFLVK
jgi:sec-independent protein translocase protein TatC